MDSFAEFAAGSGPWRRVRAQRLHDEFVADQMASIAEGMACCPDPPDVDLEALRSAVSSLTWYGFGTADLPLLRCIQRACNAFGFDCNGSLSIARWGQELLMNAVLAMDARVGFDATGRPDLTACLDLIDETHAALMRRSPRFQQFMEAIDQAAAQEIQRAND